jgi:hypothetical protein
MFRFTIRDLLWLTVMVALGVGWWLDHRAWVQKYSATAHDSEIWQARTEQLQTRVDNLAERVSGSSAPTPSAPAPSLPSE